MKSPNDKIPKKIMMHENIALFGQEHALISKAWFLTDKYCYLPPKLATPETSGRISTSVQRFDFWDRLVNQGELQVVHGFQGNHEPIIARENYPNNPRHPSVERLSWAFL